MGVVTEKGSWETGVEWRSLVELLQLFGSQGDLERLPRQRLLILRDKVSRLTSTLVLRCSILTPPIIGKVYGYCCLAQAMATFQSAN